MKTSEIKNEIKRYTDALVAFQGGNREPAILAIQLGELTNEQLLNGLKARLERWIHAARGRRIPQADMAAAMAAMTAAGVKVLIV
jgi:hypothetical protein